ncbi:MAG: GntR family transcriptional regulator [Myxococcaceae bacterium]
MSPGRSGHPAHARVAQRLRHEVLAGRWPVGARIPTEPELAQELQVSVPTVRGGVAMLVAEGMLEVKQGSGTRVRKWWESGSMELLVPLLEARGGQKAKALMEEVLSLRKMALEHAVSEVARRKAQLHACHDRLNELEQLSPRRHALREVLQLEEALLCAMADATGSLPLGFMCHTFGRVLQSAARKADRMGWRGATPTFKGLLESVAKGDVRVAQTRLTAAISARQGTYLELGAA